MREKNGGNFFEPSRRVHSLRFAAYDNKVLCPFETPLIAAGVLIKSFPRTPFKKL